MQTAPWGPNNRRGEASFCERRVSRKLTRGKFPFVLLRKPKLGGIRKESKNAPSLYSNCVPKSGSRPGPAADIPSWTGREGLEIPSFCILWIRVVRFKPSLVAAPFGPPITQRTSSNVCRIKQRSDSLRVVAGGAATTSWDPVVGKGLGSTP